ncbi:hypothetical protein CISIN_1g034778mg [Citrus sinensis]|uniref:Uncharacterized protein n=1 Tax=Citrus sinensis TaxID=2711 RepID=A0A067ELC8_CITSI|nr:hypothetical protein CISIN_1g034778mg [Citrus sinensis]
MISSHVNTTDRYLKQVSTKKGLKLGTSNMTKITKSFTLNKTKWQLIKHNHFSTRFSTSSLSKETTTVLKALCEEIYYFAPIHLL